MAIPVAGSTEGMWGRAMSAFGPKQTWASAAHMSALGGKADIINSRRYTYIDDMLWRVRNSRGRPINAPAEIAT